MVTAVLGGSWRRQRLSGGLERRAERGWSHRRQGESGAAQRGSEVFWWLGEVDFDKLRSGPAEEACTQGHGDPVEGGVRIAVAAQGQAVAAQNRRSGRPLKTAPAAHRRLGTVVAHGDGD
jgi:hypothetical protein